MHNYSVREHSRARRVRLRVTVDDGLVVVIPDGFDRNEIPALLDQERAWIDRAHRWADRQRLLTFAEPQPRLPRRISLRAMDEDWAVEYRSTASTRAVAREQAAGQLRVSGDTSDVTACTGALRRWTQRKSQQHLVPWLERLSGMENLPFGNAAVRNQNTRWASCSPLGTISINQKMLFIPRHLVRYVFIHELCHLVRLDHSSRFWAQVAVREPLYRQLDRELRSAWQYVPAWMID